MEEKILTLNNVTHHLENYFPPVCTPAEFARLQDVASNNKMPQGDQKKVFRYFLVWEFYVVVTVAAL